MRLNRRGLLSLALILGLLLSGLAAAPVVAGPSADDERVEIHFHGTVAAVDTAARTLQVAVDLSDGTSHVYVVHVPEDFDLAGVAFGDTVEVEGTLAAQGVVDATKVEKQTEDEDEDLEDEDQEDEDLEDEDDEDEDLEDVDDEDEEEEELTKVPTATLTPTAVLSPTAVPTTTGAISGTKGNRFCWDTTKTHPVAQSMASRFGVSYEQVMSWFCQGRARGFGQIILALQTARVISGTDVISGTAGMYLQKRDAGQGWGQIWKEAGLKGNWKKSSPPTVVTSTLESELTTGTPVPGAQTQGGKGKNKGADTGSGKGKGRPTLTPTPLPGQPAASSVQPRGRSRFRIRLPRFLEDLTRGKGRGGKSDK